MRTLVVCLLLVALPSSAAFINYASREINIKLVYRSVRDNGGDANLEYVYAKTNPEAKGKFISLAKNDGTSVRFFDFLPLSLGEIRGFKVRFHLYASKDGEGNEASRRLILKGVDGVVFVANGDPKSAAQNVIAFKQLQADLAATGSDWQRMPLTVQVQGDGVDEPITPEAVGKALGLSGQPIYAALPATGVGVFDTLKAAAKQALMELKKDAPAADAPAPRKVNTHH